MHDGAYTLEKRINRNGGVKLSREERLSLIWIDRIDRVQLSAQEFVVAPQIEWNEQNFVYFFGAAPGTEGGEIKIGHTGRTPVERLSDLLTGVEAVPLLAIPGTLETESALQDQARMFGAGVRREWFSAKAKVLQLMRILSEQVHEHLWEELDQIDPTNFRAHLAEISERHRRLLPAFPSPFFAHTAPGSSETPERQRAQLALFTSHWL